MKLLELKLPPAEAADPETVRRRCAEKLKRSPEKLQYRIQRRSLDARKGNPLVVLQIEILGGKPPAPEPQVLSDMPPLRGSEVIVVGAGPAGYFAALELLLAGWKPVVLERGKDARARRYDLRALMQESRVDPHSNYCFGEGGAGTYSDGKLYTRSDKRGDVARTLRMLVEHGARADITVDAHPHIGSNKLPGVVERLRASVLEHGGEVHFGQQVTGLLRSGDRLVGVQCASGREFRGAAVILATGHSARDIFHMLHRDGILIEAKAFALGLRIEHPQPLIDRLQYKHSGPQRDPHLPAAAYRLATQALERGVYSFCMCPGGLIVPAATAPGEIVVNGMSMSARDSRWANSGMVTETGPADWAAPDALKGLRGVFHGLDRTSAGSNFGDSAGAAAEELPSFEEGHPLAGLWFQQAVERAAFAWGEGSQRAPAARLTDFLAGRMSQDFPRCSYVPGLVPADFSQVLPACLLEPLRAGLQAFCSKMPAFHTEEAVLVGVESRTSSPVRIPRDPAGLFHPQLRNLYPCGEGAGYAGGILSAAMDGQRVARAIDRDLSN